MHPWLAAVLITGISVLAVFGPLWYRQRRMKKSIDQIMADIQSGKVPSRQKKPQSDSPIRIEFSADGLTVRDSRPAQKGALSVPWTDIHRISAFKTDCYTYDTISLALGLPNGRGFELPEDFGGWQEFAEALPLHLPGCKQFHEWFMVVASPAFETNLTEIYVRDVAPAGVAGPP